MFGPGALEKISVPLARGGAMIALAACLTSGSASAADYGPATEAPAPSAVPCAIGQPFWAPPAITAEDLPWASVWFGHFSGGRPFSGPYGETLVDWRDERVCFASRRECQSWISSLRRAYHQPEGYWTCMLLR